MDPNVDSGGRIRGNERRALLIKAEHPNTSNKKKKQQNRVTDTKQETRDKTKYNKEAKFKSNIEKNEKSKSKSKLGDWRQKRKHKELKEGGD